MEKLDLHDTAGLTRYAISAGIIESSVRFDHRLGLRLEPISRFRPRPLSIIALATVDLSAIVLHYRTKVDRSRNRTQVWQPVENS
jgi:hypothetical protein